ncbi:MAG TPA: LssY C-terminal domain-containing protein [Candidatus Saccharimonadales bacterium]
MLQTLIRAAKRFALLVPILVIAYLSIFNIFPLLNNQLPLVVALIITYLLGAYVLIPALIRLVRIVVPAKHLPLYCVTPDGFASDPLNVGLIGTRQELIDAMTAAGWYEADRHTLKNSIRTALSTVYGWSYPTAPMSHLYLFGRMQDVGFQIPIKDAPAGSRHHVRFWATTYRDGEQLNVRSIDWQHREAHVRHDRLLWVGAASRDIGVAFIRHNAQVTHMIDPDTDSERELIVNQLRKAGLGTVKHSVKLGDPYKLTNRVWRGYLQTDGRMTVLELTPKTATQGRDSSKPRKRSRQSLPEKES